MIIFDDVSFKYKKGTRFAVENLTEKIQRNTVITGPSGSGKSTILRMVNGLIPHFYQGEFIGDVSVNDINTRASNTCQLFRIAGFVHQNPDAQVFNEITEKEIIFTLENAGIPPKIIGERLEWIKERLKIDSILSKKSHELSGGEKHILTIASILALGSPIILLDEPFATLDGLSRTRLREVLATLEDKLIIITEHRIDETLSISKDFIFIRDSKSRLKTQALLNVDFKKYRVREPEILRLARLAGVDKLSKDVILEELRKQGYKRKFDCDESSSEPLLILDDVSFSYNGKPAVDGVSLEVKRGSVVVLLGPNGAGKTTLMKLMVGIFKPQSGKIMRKTRAGYVPHNPQDIFFKTRVIDEIRVGAEDERWIREVIELLSLEEVLERSPFTLSEGEKKRVAMAAILSMKPGILLLDEPTTGQDGETVVAISKIIKRLSQEGISVVVSTHDIEFAKDISCKWVLMEEGKIRGVINPGEISQNELDLLKKLHIEPGLELHLNAHGPQD